jgi:hypothetical protein
LIRTIPSDQKVPEPRTRRERRATIPRTGKRDAQSNERRKPREHAMSLRYVETTTHVASLAQTRAMRLQRRSTARLEKEQEAQQKNDRRERGREELQDLVKGWLGGGSGGGSS